MGLIRAAEWLGIAAGTALWVASLGISAQSSSASSAHSESRRAPSATPFSDPMFVRSGALPRGGNLHVAGHVVNERGAPVPGVAVLVVPSEIREQSAQKRQAITGASGDFSATGLAPGRYTFFAVEGTTMGAGLTGTSENIEVLNAAEETENIRIVLNQRPTDA